MTQGVVQRRIARLAAAINQKAARLAHRERITADDLALVFLEASGRCAYCGIEVDPMGASFDHAVPFARGGTNTRANLVLSCITCQRTKFTKLPAEHIEYQRLQRQCRTCRRAFRPRFADIKRGYGFYCSRRCSGTAGGEAPRAEVLAAG